MQLQKFKCNNKILLKAMQQQDVSAIDIIKSRRFPTARTMHTRIIFEIDTDNRLALNRCLQIYLGQRGNSIISEINHTNIILIKWPRISTLSLTSDIQYV